jgi:hydroxyacylglutathione hydrolase
MPEPAMFAIHPIPAFTDNYLWCLHDGRRAWVVDPGDAAPVTAWLRANDLELEGILITHHHPDHIGGVAELTAEYGPTLICGPDNPRIPALTRTVGAGDAVELLGHRFEVLAVPGHTLDHIAYFCRGAQPPLLFCGDTLFAGGCGRLFEGTPEQMYDSLQRLAALPAETAVYCTHEYTQANLRFARAVEPENDVLARRAEAVDAARARGEVTLPSTVGQELATNPFLRSEVPAVAAAARQHEPAARSVVEVFAAIRRWKDVF